MNEGKKEMGSPGSLDGDAQNGVDARDVNVADLRPGMKQIE